MGMALGGGVIGLLIGAFMGIITPSYYVALFGAENPIEFGLGAGLSQGLVMGFVVGLLTVAVQAFGKQKPQP